MNLIESGKVSYSIASNKVFPALFENSDKTVLEVATWMNVIQDSDEGNITNYIKEVITSNPTEVQRYIAGEKQLVGFLMGQLMKVSQGKADPKQANPLLRKMLDEIA